MLDFDALQPGPRQTIVGRLDRDGIVYLAGERSARSLIGSAFSLRAKSNDVECCEFIASEQEACAFAVDRKPPQGATRTSAIRPLKGISMAVCSIDLETECVRFKER